MTLLIIKLKLPKIMKNPCLSIFPCLVLAIAALVGCSPSEEVSKAAPKPAPPSVGLHEAVVLGSVDLVSQHVAAGSDLNVRDPNPEGNLSTPLMVAALFGEQEIVKILIDAGAEVNIQDKDGGTALHGAAFLGYPQILKDLLAAGANRDIRNNSGATALESVQAPWAMVAPIYQFLQGIIFKPLGREIDIQDIQAKRPEIVELLK